MEQAIWNMQEVCPVAILAPKKWGGHFGAKIDLGGATENCV